jgi:hypothetical protein
MMTEGANPFAAAAGLSSEAQSSVPRTEQTRSQSTQWKKAVHAAFQNGQSQPSADGSQQTKSGVTDPIGSLAQTASGSPLKPVGIMGNPYKGLWAELQPSAATQAAWELTQADVQQAAMESAAMMAPVVAIAPAVSLPQPSQNGEFGLLTQPNITGNVDGLLPSMVENTVGDLTQTKSAFVHAQVEASFGDTDMSGMVSTRVDGAQDITAADSFFMSAKRSNGGGTLLTEPITSSAPKMMLNGNKPLITDEGSVSRNGAFGSSLPLEMEAQPTAMPGIGVLDSSFRDASVDPGLVRQPTPYRSPLESNMTSSSAWNQLKNDASGLPTTNDAMRPVAAPMADALKASVDSPPASVVTPPSPAVDSVIRTSNPVVRDWSNVGPSDAVAAPVTAEGPQLIRTAEPVAPIRVAPDRMFIQSANTQQASSAPTPGAMVETGASAGFSPTAESPFGSMLEEPAIQAPSTSSAKLLHPERSDKMEVAPTLQASASETGGANPFTATGRVTAVERETGVQSSLFDAENISADEVPELPQQDFSQMDIDIDDPAGTVRLDVSREASQVAIRMETPEEVLEEYRQMREEIDEAIAQSGMSMSDFDAQSGENSESETNKRTEERYGVEPEARAERLESHGSRGRLLNRIV